MDATSLSEAINTIGHNIIKGWLVDLHDGLYLYEDKGNDEPDFLNGIKIKIANSQIMLAIIREIPILGGGLYAICYRSIIVGDILHNDDLSLYAKELYVNYRIDKKMHFVDINNDLIEKYRLDGGDYIFNKKTSFCYDWMDNENN